MSELRNLRAVLRKLHQTPKTNKNDQYNKNHVLECKWIAQPPTRAASNPRNKQN